MTDVIVQRQGTCGRITLNRPNVLNAVNHGMIAAISDSLDEWIDDREIAAIIIDGAGEKAFCAGGDLVTIYKTGREKPDLTHNFCADEYRLNARIARYPKPIVTLLNGIVMGGGVGIGCHASHRIVTERSLVAMPEVTIGFCPDVGGTWIMSRSPGYVGEYLGLTGARMNGADAIFAGFADIFVPSEKLSEFVDALLSSGDVKCIDQFSQNPPESDLSLMATEIDHHFGVAELLPLVTGLTGSHFAIKTSQQIRAACPSAVAAAFYAIREARSDANVESSLAREYRFAYRSLEGDNFYEGIRAAVVDKDRAPKWNPARLEDVPQTFVSEVFASLGAAEWKGVPEN